jgi:hypothetical protein
MSIRVRKAGDDEFVIEGGVEALSIDLERYEDLYYSVPEEAGKYKNETEFFRNLIDNICADQAQRDTMNRMLEAAGDKVAALRSIQDQVRQLGV